MSLSRAVDGVNITTCVREAVYALIWILSFFSLISGSPTPPPRHPQLQQVLAGQLLNQSFKYMDKSASRLGLSTHAVA